MISVSSSYNAITSTSNYAYEWQIINGANTYGKDDIVTGTIKTAVYEKLSIGNTIAAELNLTLRGVSGISTSDPLEVQFRAVAGVLTSAWYTKGIFYIDTIESSPYSEIVQITAFDAMLKSEVDFMPTGSYVPMTTAQVYSQIVTDMGVSSHSATSTWLTNNPVTLSNAPNVGVGGTTDRDMLSYLGVMYVGNWVISPQNELKLVFADLAAANTVTVGDAVQSMDASPSDTVERVKLWLDSNTYYLAPTGITEAQWLALGGICIEAHLPFYATQALASTIYNAFRLKTYYPYTAQGAYIDPKYEVGDGISLDATNPFSSFIASQTLTMDGISPSDVQFKGEEKVNSLYPYVSSVQRDTIYQVSKAQDTADAAQTAASNAQSSANNANYREQIIYRSAVSGTNTMAANTTWVTDATGAQNTWTTVRPVYNSSYPVLFVATQRQSVSQSSGTTCTCTTPAKDETTTVIDGGHITTGTIDASAVNVTNINASNINSGTITGITISGNTVSGNTITGGTISGTTITGSTLTSATSSGSVQIANGNINFFKNATTTGTPFSQIKHTYDSGQGDSIEWSNSGYTKLVNTGGGQWTADFLQFALNASNPSLKFLIFNDSNGTMTKFQNSYQTFFDGGQIYANKAGHGDNAAIRVAQGTANTDTSVFVKRTDTDRSIELLVGSGGVNRGLYVRDANMDAWLLYYDDANLNITKPVVFSYPKQTRANLNMVCNLLNSSVGTTEVQVSTDITEYSGFIIIGVPDTTAKSTCFIPKVCLSSTVTRWQVADNTYYIAADVRTSGNSLYIKVASTNHGTKTLEIYGLRGA